MKILLISDSHERRININLEEFDLIIHAGDYGISRHYLEDNGIKYVAGNCDFSGLDYLEFLINEKKYYVVHGHQYRVKYDLLSLYLKAKEINANIVIYGHTHQAYYEEKNGIIFINPGAYNYGEYAIIDDNIISFFRNGNKYKEINMIG